MADARFDIVVFGLQPGRDPHDVKLRLARGFGVSEARVTPLLFGPVVVKRGIDQPTAQVFLNVLYQSGVHAEARPAANSTFAPSFADMRGQPKLASGQPSPSLAPPPESTADGTSSTRHPSGAANVPAPQLVPMAPGRPALPSFPLSASPASPHPLASALLGPPMPLSSEATVLSDPPGPVAGGPVAAEATDPAGPPMGAQARAASPPVEPPPWAPTDSPPAGGAPPVSLFAMPPVTEAWTPADGVAPAQAGKANDRRFSFLDEGPTPGPAAPIPGSSSMPASLSPSAVQQPSVSIPLPVSAIEARSRPTNGAPAASPLIGPPVVPTVGVPDLLGPPPGRATVPIAPAETAAGSMIPGPPMSSTTAMSAASSTMSTPAMAAVASRMPAWMDLVDTRTQPDLPSQRADTVSTPQLVQFVDWATQNRVPGADTAEFEEAARTLWAETGATRLTPAIIDSVIWQEERAGRPEHRLQLLRAVGRAITDYEDTGALVPAVASERASSVGRPTIDELRRRIGDCIIDLDRTSARPEPRLAACRTVLEVAPLCPASQAGVKRGDLVVSVDMAPAVIYNLEAPFRSGTSEWEVYLRESQQIVRIKTNGAPIGMRLGPTAASVQAGYKMDAEDLLSLWEMGEYRAVLDRARSVVGKTTGGLFGARKGNRDCPEYALLGACLIEVGESDEGFEILHDYLESYADRWTRNYSGLALYYYALANLESDRAKAREIAIDAYDMYKCGPTVDLVERLTGERPSLRPQRWTGQRFPVAYELAVEHSARPSSLQVAMDTMNDQQLLLVCSMGGHRANGPYSSFMNQYVRYVSTLDGIFYNLHVATSSRLESNDAWFVGEKRASELGIRFEILYDEQNTVSTALGVGYCPYVVAIDNQGIVRGEDLGSDIELWNALVNFATNVST